MKELFILALIIAVVYYLEFPQSFANGVMSLLTKGKIKEVHLRKPLGCSLCMCFWITEIVMLCIFPYTEWLLGTLYCLCLGLSIKYIMYAIRAIDLIITKVFIIFEKLMSPYNNSKGE